MGGSIVYILKNALKSIGRSFGRNVLIGVIVLVIGISSCIALSIREAADSTRDRYLDELKITAQISLDRQSMMEDFKGQHEQEFDRDSMKEMLTNNQELTLEELLQYKDAKSVKDFYYSGTSTVNTDDNWEAVDTTGIEEETDSDSQIGFDRVTQMMEQGMGGKRPGRMGNQGDATIVGYSSDEAMTAFLSGTATVVDGEMFEEGTSDYNCAISEELATYNELAVGDTIKVVNPNNEDESYELMIVGLYKNEQSSTPQAGMMGGFSTATDAANQIYMSYAALSDILESSEETATKALEADADTDIKALANQVNGTYVFESIEDYEKFEKEARVLGLDETYSISSSDITSYEQSLEPLNNLSEYAMYFFVVVLIIGGIILAVLNMFNIRERKYEIGVLAAIGMKKWKIAVQYVLELLVVTFVAIFLGAAIGAFGSVSITNALLEKQISSETIALEGQLGNFGRGEMPEEMPGDMPGGNRPQENGKGMGDFFKNMGNTMTDYVTEVESATNLSVVIQLIGVGILLTMISSLFAIIFVLRYDPLKIMSNRD